MNKKLAILFSILQMITGIGFISLYIWSSEQNVFSAVLWSDFKLWLAVMLLILGVIGVYAAASYIGTPIRKDMKRILDNLPPGVEANNKEEDKDEWQQLMQYTKVLIYKIKEESNTKERILADAVHEMRTPLSVIRGQVESILEGSIDCKPEQLLPLIDETSRLSRLIHDLRELSLAESGKLRMNYEWVEFSELIDLVWERFEAEAAEREIQCEIKTASGQVLCDKQRMEQVLINLIGNAVSYTPDFGSIEIEARIHQYVITVVVRNSGQGISLEHLPYVFQRFYRADASRQRSKGGMGLGLAIAKHYVEAHEGSISVDSNPGKGAVFQFTVPLFPQS
ncbi:sensor histidine kinase [Paenibacillus dakarensis]|uniref:sensor histidine kinase n=1 Tax=Paenibacillus dakarensis TaxID=1527293 RepID=UPI001478FAD4|nr:HAMP domain-containing sensor histidine kinase [Paenibacillus dakarensis]